MIKIPLIALLMFCGVYGWRQRRLSPFIGFVTPLVCMVGVALVIEPDWSQRAAGLLGVGRGADLILYLWTVVSVLLLANVHFRMRSYQEMLTVLTRELALLEARQDRDR